VLLMLKNIVATQKNKILTDTSTISYFSVDNGPIVFLIIH
jgi:hypothetical protein